jgi:hypothetical protein
MKPITLVLLLIATAVTPVTQAQACSTLRPEPAAELRAKRLAFLHRYSDEIVFGRWTETDRIEAEYIIIRKGFVTQSFEGRDRRFQISFSEEINCGFPAHPKNGDKGIFFLRAESPHHEDDEVEYDIMHFEGVEAAE